MSDGYNHCILCNEIVGEIGFHILISKQHKKRVAKSKNKIKKSLKLSKNAKYCEICLEYVDNVKEHKKRPSHEMKVDEKVFDLTKNERFKPINYQLRRNESDNTISCRVCEIIIADDNIEEHLNDSEHVTKYKALLKSNNVVKTGDMIQCTVCNSTMYPTREIHHILSKKHLASIHRIPQDVLKETNICENKSFNMITENQSLSDTPGPSCTNKWQLEVMDNHSVESSNTDDHDTQSGSFHSLANIERNFYDLEEESGVIANITAEDIESECTEAETYLGVDLLFKQCFCDICNIYLPLDKNIISEHKSNIQHRKALDKHGIFLSAYQLVYIKVSKGTSNRTSTPWWCLVCSSATNNPYKHVLEANHKLKYDELLSAHSLIKQNFKLFFCNVCDSFVQMSEELQHINFNATHIKHMIDKKRMSTLTATNNQQQQQLSNDIYDVSCSPDPVAATCSVVTSNIEDKSRMDIEHTLSDPKSNKKHKKNAVKHNVDSNMHYTCAVCNVTLMNTLDNIISHEMYSEHQRKLNELNTTKNTETIKPHECTICNVVVPNTTADIRLHETGGMHKEFKKMLTKPNKEIKKQPYKCTVCNILIPNNSDNVRTHEISSFHKQNLIETKSKKNNKINKQKPHKCELCNVEVSRRNMLQHMNTPLHKRKCIEIIGKTNKDGADICKICNVSIPHGANNVNIHENGYLHQKNLKKITQELSLLFKRH